MPMQNPSNENVGRFCVFLIIGGTLAFVIPLAIALWRWALGGC